MQSLSPVPERMMAMSVKRWQCGRFLEEELARRYRDAAPATLALLQTRCEGITEELFSVDKQLKSSQDVAALRRAGTAPTRVMTLHSEVHT